MNGFITEQLNWILTTWIRYWGNGIYQYLLTLSLLFLVLRRRSRKSTQHVALYVLLFLILFFFPVSAAIIQKCIGADVYWRVLWLLPAIPLIALGATELTETLGRHLLKPSTGRKGLLTLLLVLMTAAASMTCINGMLLSDNYIRVHNYQKVPDEVAHICNLIQEHAQGKTVKLASDENIIPYVRVYDASILMPYGRRGDGAADKAAKQLYEHMYFNTFKYARIAKLAKKTDCNFIAIVLTKDSAVKTMDKHGYQLIGTINSYGVFQLTE